MLKLFRNLPQPAYKYQDAAQVSSLGSAFFSSCLFFSAAAVPLAQAEKLVTTWAVWRHDGGQGSRITSLVERLSAPFANLLETAAQD